MRTKTSGLLAVLATTSALTWSATSAASASCMMDERPMQQRIDEAEIVFVGTVDALAHGNTTATFQVEEVWKGPAFGDQVTVVGGSGQDGMATSVDRNWSPNERYLVFPYMDGNRLSDNSCTPTQPWSEELTEHRPDDAVIRLTSGEPNVVTVAGDSPAADDGGDATVPVAIAVGAVVVAGAATWFVRRRATP